MKKRPHISVYIAVSLDGYIAREDGSLDWLDRVGGFNEDYGFQGMLGSIDAVILGRKTYEVASTVPDPYPGKRVIVLSNHLSFIKQGAELYSGDLDDLLLKLGREGIKHVWVDGGLTISQFLASQKVDTVTLSIIPVILGSGIPLFNVLGKEIPCRLISSQSYSSGLVQLNYEIIKQFTDAKDKICFQVVDYGSDACKKSVELREETLRKPFGSFFTQKELDEEKGYVHVAGFLGQELCAAAVLAPEANQLKMRRVAIKGPFQNKGIGSALMAFCDGYATKHGYEEIYCHARETAIPFYLKNQYVLEGKSFYADGILHRTMRKSIEKNR